MSLELLLSIWIGALGLIVGSYLNVVIYRLPRQHSTVLPRSRCPYCDGLIRPWDNIPLLSYVLLGGRCRRCRAPIAARYPLVEAATATLFIISFRLFGLTTTAVTSILFGCLLIVLGTIDAEHLILPDKLTFPGIALGLGLQSWIPQATWVEALIGTLVGAGSIILIINGWFWLRHEEAMGLGDANMLAMVGAFLGWKGVVVALFCGSLLGALTGIGLLLLGRAQLKSRLPFGTFLAAGGLIALFVGPALVDHYLQLL